MLTSEPVQLSIIVPVLNEADAIAVLIHTICQQKIDISWEILIVDGGSQDGSVDLAIKLLKDFQIPGEVIQAERGRAKQMNCGASRSKAEYLLFLHADSQFQDINQIQQAAEFMQKQNNIQKSVAGHFHIIFSDVAQGLAYRFYQGKTALSLPGTINGDQGFWLSRQFFMQMGGYDESLDYMEDSRLADKIFREGRWITLPGTLLTSARRFEQEGLAKRQCLNALLKNFDAIGMTDFFSQAKHIYRQQSDTKQLELRPFLISVHKISLAQGIWIWLKYWYGTGKYVGSNVWQLFFFLDCILFSNRNLCLRFYQRLSWVLKNPTGYSVCALVTFLVFYGLLIYSMASWTVRKIPGLSR